MRVLLLTLFSLGLVLHSDATKGVGEQIAEYEQEIKTEWMLTHETTPGLNESAFKAQRRSEALGELFKTISLADLGKYLLKNPLKFCSKAEVCKEGDYLYQVEMDSNWLENLDLSNAIHSAHLVEEVSAMEVYMKLVKRASDTLEARCTAHLNRIDATSSDGTKAAGIACLNLNQLFVPFKGLKMARGLDEEAIAAVLRAVAKNPVLCADPIINSDEVYGPFCPADLHLLRDKLKRIGLEVEGVTRLTTKLIDSIEPAMNIISRLPEGSSIKDSLMNKLVSTCFELRKEEKLAAGSPSSDICAEISKEMVS